MARSKHVSAQVTNPARQLPERANLEHLKNEAKARLKALRAEVPEAKLSTAQLETARAYGFPSWRKLKAHVEESGAVIDRIYQCAAQGKIDELKQRLDEHPELINTRGGGINGQTPLFAAAWYNHPECVRLLLDRGADVHIRDVGDNAYALHFACENADFEIVRILVEAGSDTVGEGDGHQLGVLGWATCFRRVREDVAKYLLKHGARFNIWSAIALNRLDVVRELIAQDRALLKARMSNSEVHRTALHHAVICNRPEIVEFLVAEGADVNALDDTAATALANAGSKTDRRITSLLEKPGTALDLREALAAGRFDLAETILKAEPDRIRPGGRDQNALCVAVLRKAASTARWLLAHGADPNAKVVTWDVNATPMHFAVGDHDVEMVHLLLDAGADPNVRDDRYHSTCLGWAEYFKHEDLAKLLRARGGNT